MKVQITVRQDTVGGVEKPKNYIVDIDSLLCNAHLYSISEQELQSLVTQLTSEAEKALRV